MAERPAKFTENPAAKISLIGAASSPAAIK
jgi:hypothetical protein